MDKGRETQLFELLHRGVAAIEKLGEDPVMEMEIGPPVCPHCNSLNPAVTTSGSTYQGRLFTFYAEFDCKHCGKRFYGMPAQWSMHEDMSTLMIERDGREEFLNDSNSGNGQRTPPRKDEAGPGNIRGSFAG